MAEKFALKTEMELRGMVYRLSYPHSIPIIDYHTTREVIGVATLVSLTDDEAVYESSIPIGGRDVSGAWNNEDGKLRLVEVALVSIPGYPTSYKNWKLE